MEVKKIASLRNSKHKWIKIRKENEEKGKIILEITIKLQFVQEKVTIIKGIQERHKNKQKNNKKYNKNQKSRR